MNLSHISLCYPRFKILRMLCEMTHVENMSKSAHTGPIHHETDPWTV